eukprot:m.98691 g.98691  ORF g.98691 m.98691 type:complete len:516 (+) comp37003_c0_seq9:12-1559(+)
MGDSLRPWLRGLLPRGEAEDLLCLDGLSDGLFLVRERLNPPGELVLAIAHQRKIHHYLIRQREGRYQCGNGPPFPDLDSLIDYYERNEGGFCCLLRQPCGMRSKYYEEVNLQEVREFQSPASPMSSVSPPLPPSPYRGNPQSSTLPPPRPVPSQSRPSQLQGPSQPLPQLQAVQPKPVPRQAQPLQQIPTAPDFKKNIFERLKCLTEVEDDGLRQTFSVQFMGTKELELSLEDVRTNIGSIIAKIAQKGKRQPVTLMVSTEGLKVVQSKKKMIEVQYPSDRLLCCISSDVKPKHFAAVIEAEDPAASSHFTVIAFKNHIGSVGSVEDISETVSGLIIRHRSLSSTGESKKLRQISSNTFDAPSADQPASDDAKLGAIRRSLSERPPAPLPLSIDEKQLQSPLLTKTIASERFSTSLESPTKHSQWQKRASEPAIFQPGLGVHQKRLPKQFSLPETDRIARDKTSHAYVNVSIKRGMDESQSHLPEGWTVHWSDRSRRYFYHNAFTNATTWEKPDI